MNIFENVDQQDFLRRVTTLISEQDKIVVTVLGWKDWDYFKEFCEQDGGIEENQYEIYNNLPLSRKMSSRTELVALISKLGKFPFLASRNGRYKFSYDIHVWTANHYIVYNFHLLKCIIKERNLFNKVFSPVITPDWQTDEITF